MSVCARARAHCLRGGLQYIDYSCLVAYYCRATVEFRRIQVNYTAQFTSQSSSLCSRAQHLLIFQTSSRGNDINTKVSEADTKYTNYDGLCPLPRPPSYKQFRKCYKYVDILKNIDISKMKPDHRTTGKSCLPNWHLVQVYKIMNITTQCSFKRNIKAR